MYVIREDMKILCSREVMDLQNCYAEKFGEDFICFNYADFPRTEERSSAEIYRDALREAVKRDEPTRIVSKWKDVDEMDFSGYTVTPVSPR